MLFSELNQELRDTLQDDIWRDGDAICISMDAAQIFIEYVEERDSLYLYAHLAEMPRSGLTALGASLLKASLFGAETNGSAVFAYDDEVSQIVLWEMHVLENMTLEQFKQAYILFMAAVDGWRKRFAEELEQPRSKTIHFA